MIDKISNITNVQQAYQPNQKRGGAKAEPSDRVDLSSTAKAAAGRADAVKVVQSLGAPVRSGKVAEAKRKLDSGELLSDKVIERIAELVDRLL